jgi:hypothetical protein
MISLWLKYLSAGILGDYRREASGGADVDGVVDVV